MTSSRDENDLLRLLSRVCDDVATDEEIAQLAEAVRVDARVRLLYLEFFADQAELQLLERTTPLVDLEPITESSVDYQKVFARPLAASAPSRSPFAAPRGLPGAVNSLARFVNQIPVFSLIAAAACSFALLTGLALWRTPAQPLTAQAVVATQSAVVARIVDQREAQWRGPAPAENLGNRLRVGETLELHAGLAEISFGSGARVIVEGPTRLKILQSNGVALQLGKLYAVVHQATAQGFIVQTPRVKITDLGTEFGVVVSDSGDTEVCCFEGSVQAQDSVRQAASQVLNKGETLCITATRGAGESGAVIPWISRSQPSQSFVRRLSNQPLVERPHYADVVQQLQPVGYWRFDAADFGAQATDSTERGHTGKMIDNACVAPQGGVIGGGLWLDGKQGYVAIADHPDFHFGGNSFSFAGWMRISQRRGDHTLIAKGDGTNRLGVVWNGRIDGTGRFRFGALNAATKVTTFETAPGPDLRDDRWHHLVGVFDRDAREQRYYVDGRRTYVRALRDVPRDATFDGSEPLQIGVADQEQFAAGLIDEVALFDRALNDEEVRELFSARRQSS